MNMRITLFVLACSLLTYCGGKVSGPEYSLKGFNTESIGGGATAAEFITQGGKKLSSGHTISGVRTGVWTSYHPNEPKIKTVTNYINGQKNGPEITIDENGRVTAITHFRNNRLHGTHGLYKNGRPISETTYANGELNGPFKEYSDSGGTLQRSGTMKNGKPHGEMLYYADGEVSMRYQYDNGEKISGGIVKE